MPDLELEDDGDGFRANPAESLRGEGDFKVADLLDKVVSCGEAGSRACGGPPVGCNLHRESVGPSSSCTVASRRWSGAAQDGNGAPKPASPRVFTLLGDGDGRLFNPMGLLLGKL